MEGPTEGDTLYVVVDKVANGSGDGLARPTDDPSYAGKNIHIPDSDRGDIYEIEIVHTSPMHVVGKPIQEFSLDDDVVNAKEVKETNNLEEQKLVIRKENDYGVEYKKQVKSTREKMPDRI
ncbi:hypothetical protein [Natrinema halophilum]|uniref:TRAM domain-containing protein n=1 Tax=Natrinema halophilum TaxID=1699371 RepID=A0A7D5KS20_9EURY|nr:hypothetical protein [Natrinema halophilum]QLG49024.1 hypothetical protein HYG82_09270 [Natrinema halophilum]